MEPTALNAIILDHCARYPALESADLLKLLHQSVCGCGHFISDPSAAESLLLREWTQDNPITEPEPLDGPYCRVHLGALRTSGLRPETLLRLFLRSADTTGADAALLADKLAALTELARTGQLPVPYPALAAAAEQWQAAGFPALHHSPAFRAAYRPAYRVIRRELARLLPLFSAIDRGLASQGRLTVAIEGGSAAGKTTLAALLADVYGCAVLHMDDFFLQPRQRTPQRLAEPGGNVDRERFAEEVLTPLRSAAPILYRRYCCHTQTLEPPVRLLPGPLTVVEGAYSLHPALAPFYDFSVLLRVDPATQRRRILARNSPEDAERFFSTWIPLENTYFKEMDPASRCDLILEVEP